MGKSSRSIASTSLPSSALCEPAIDLAHLQRMTFGDQHLQCELLQLFDRQAAILLARTKHATAAQLAELAHTLRGSALGVGARSLARAAETTETAASGNVQPRLTDALAELTARVGDARSAASELLRTLTKRQ